MPEGILRIRDIELRVVAGALPREKLSPRTLYLNAEWRGRFEPGSPPPVDYSAACSCLAPLGEREYDYIEEVASAALAALRGCFPEGSWTVKVVKVCPPCPLRVGEASFEVTG
jgi:hypothetical protein